MFTDEGYLYSIWEEVIYIIILTLLFHLLFCQNWNENKNKFIGSYLFISIGCIKPSITNTEKRLLKSRHTTVISSNNSNIHQPASMTKEFIHRMHSVHIPHCFTPFWSTEESIKKRTQTFFFFPYSGHYLLPLSAWLFKIDVSRGLEVLDSCSAGWTPKTLTWVQLWSPQSDPNSVFSMQIVLFTHFVCISRLLDPQHFRLSGSTNQEFWPCH